MDNHLKTKIEKIIDKESQCLNAEVSSRLNQARQLALTGGQKKSFFFSHWLIPAMALTAMMVYLLLPLSNSQIIQQRAETISIDDYAVLEEIEYMDVLEQIDLVEDYEFYEWLSHADENISI